MAVWIGVIDVSFSIRGAASLHGQYTRSFTAFAPRAAQGRRGAFSPRGGCPPGPRPPLLLLRHGRTPAAKRTRIGSTFTGRRGSPASSPIPGIPGGPWTLEWSYGP